MKKLILILSAVLVLLLACVLLIPGSEETPAPTQPSSPAPIVPSAPPTVPTAAPTDPAPTETQPVPTEPEPTEPPMLYSNPLTGQPMAELSESRPIAVVLNNVKAAQPQLGVSLADILCEVMTEGGTTRCIGIYHDLKDVGVLGSIRSARPYMISLAQSFDAVFVHAGRSEEAKQLLASTGWDHLDGVHGSGASKYFYRDPDRLAAGYSKEHTMCITAEQLLAYAEKRKLTMTRPSGVQYGWQFAEDVPLSGTAAQSIRIRFSLSGSTSTRVKATVMDYDAAAGLYYASQYDKDYIDGTSGDQLAFRNVLILRCAAKNQGDDAGHLTIDMVGSGTGYYACGGQMVPIRWTRSKTSQPFTFTLEDGTPLTLAVGKTYIGFVSTKSVIDFS